MKSFGLLWKVILFGIFGVGMNVGLFANTLAVDSDLSKQIPSYSDCIQIYEPDSLALSKEKVGNWIKTRMEVAELQKKMKTNADAYENVVETFNEKRADLLTAKGWSVTEFDEVKDRIHAAISAMDMADDLAASQEKHEKEVAEIRENNFYTDSHKEQMIEGLNKMRKQQKEQYIDPTKDDWSAVRPYRAIFEEVTSWIAGNRATPPELSF